MLRFILVALLLALPVAAWAGEPGPDDTPRHPRCDYPPPCIAIPEPEPVPKDPAIVDLPPLEFEVRAAFGATEAAGVGIWLPRGSLAFGATVDWIGGGGATASAECSSGGHYGKKKSCSSSASADSSGEILFMVGGRYVQNWDKPIRPFVGVGFGAYGSDFAWSTEAGVTYPLVGPVGLSASYRYVGRADLHQGVVGFRISR